MPSRRFLRIAFDIGSGATKVCGAICYRPAASSSAAPTAAVVIEKVLYEKEQVLMIGQAVKHASADGKTIPPRTIEEVHSVLGGLIGRVYSALEAHNADPSVAPEAKIPLRNADLWEHHHAPSSVIETATALAAASSTSAVVSNSGSGSSSSIASPPPTPPHVPTMVRAEREERFGIATAIFRSAVNGPAVLASLRSSPALRLRCAILPQDDEAAIGYETARQHLLTGPLPRSVSDAARLVSYDSGAASFQLTTANIEGGPLRYFNGQWGSTIAHLALLKVVGADREKRRAAGEENVPEPSHELDPNPVGPEASEAFVRHVLADLNDPKRHPTDAREHFRALFRSHAQVGAEGVSVPPSHTLAMEGGRAILVQAFGGDTCAFMMASRAFGGAPYVSRDALLDKAVKDLSLKTMAEISALGYVQPEMLLAKLLLVYAVMSHLGIEGLHFQRAIGNTRALVSLDKYWVKKDEPLACPNLRQMSKI